MNILSRLRALFRRQQLNAEMDEEMRHHLDAQMRRNLAAGMSLEEAHYAARRSFGGVEQIKERARDQRSWRWLEDLARDLRFAGRTLRKNPGFTLVAVVTLALGIGANTAIFSRVDQLLVRDLPVRNPDRLVLLGQPRSGRPDFGAFSYLSFRDYQRAGAALADFSALGEIPVGLGTSEATERQRALLVSGNYFSMLGVQPALGRTFAANEGAEMDDAFVVVLSHGLWVRRFGADPQVLGQTIALNGRPFTIIGVTPREFAGTTRGQSPDLYAPLTAYGQLTPDRPGGRNPLSERNHIWLSIIGRLREGVAPGQAQAAVQGVFEETRRVNSRGNASSVIPQMLLTPGAQGFPGNVQEVGQPLRLLFATAGLILLIACANLANLQLARASNRAREFAVRLAVGAGRSRLIRQLLTESLLLALLGGGLGLVVAYWLTGALRSWLPVADSGLDARVLGFALVISVVTGLLFGLVPALRASRPDLVPELKGSRSVAGGRSRWTLRGALVVLQVALSLLVLVSAGLCVRSLKKLQDIDPGFSTSPVLLLSFDLGLNNATTAQANEFYARLLERSRVLPGVESAGLVQGTPLSGRMSGTSIARIEGYAVAPNERLSADMNLVSPDYFRTIGLPLVRGRDFTASDSMTGLKTVVVNDAFAQRYWPGQDPLGRKIYFPGPNGGSFADVVGVIQVTRGRSLTEAPRPTLYFPVAQQSARDLTLAVRIAIDPAAVTAALRREVKGIDATVPIVRVRTLEQQKADSLMLQRLAATLLSGFGALALLLAALGIYGVLAYSVSARTQEIGVRIALGATVRDVLRLILGQGLGLVGAGVILGLAGAFAATRLLRGLLHDVTPQDPLTFAAAVGVMGLVAVVACYLPARRATRISPLTALRSE
jgi:predicted permease